MGAWSQTTTPASHHETQREERERTRESYIHVYIHDLCCQETTCERERHTHTHRERDCCVVLCVCLCATKIPQPNLVIRKSLNCNMLKAILSYLSFFSGNENYTDVGLSSGSIFDHVVEDYDGRIVNLTEFRGAKAYIVVNVASKCGLTATNYKELNSLHEKYDSSGLKILAFPCNNFGRVYFCILNPIN